MRALRNRADRPMNCHQVGRRLQRYLDGDLDDLSARRILRHLEQCRDCGLEADLYAAMKAGLARRHQPPPDDAVRRLREFGDRLADGHPGNPG